MIIQKLSAIDAVASVNSTLQGLPPDEAQRRLREYGPNEVEKVARQPVILRFLREFAHFFAWILWVAAALAFLGEWNQPGHGMGKVGYAIVAVILISGVFSFWQEYRVERTLAALRRLLPRSVEVLRAAKVVQLPAEQVVPGDIVLLEAGDNVPADCRLIEAHGVRVNNATVTGESQPLARDADPTGADELIHSRNVLLAGTSMVAGQAKALVFATGAHTEFGKIARLSQTSAEPISPLRKEVAHLSRLIAALAITIGLLFFAIGWFIGVPFWEDFIFAIGIIVAMVPEGLLPTLTLSLVLATQRMAKRNVLIRYLPSVEALGATTVICTDKTGTLTQNRMAVTHLFLGEGWTTPADLQREVARHYRRFFLTAHLCHDLRESGQGGKAVLLGDPMESALVQMARQALPDTLPAYRKLDEIPFDAESMRLSTVYATENGHELYCKGAPEAVIPLCAWMLGGQGVQQFGRDERDRVQAAVERMAEQGLRVLALAYRPLEPGWQREHLEEKLILAGLVGLADPPRPEVPEAVRKCRAAGIKVIMVTGDHPRTAGAIGREIGLVGDNPMLVTGEVLRSLSTTQLRLALDAPEIIFARVGADQKTRIVEALKQKRHVVAVTGDGVNDAPALRSAHIGVAMGLSGTDVAKESADMILLDDNFASIVNAVEEGRAVFDNIRKFLTYILAHNVAELFPYVVFALFRIPLPLTPIQVLAIDMGTDSLTALGLGAERAEPGVMQRPPRPVRERLMNWPLALRAYLFLGLIEAIAALAAFFFLLEGGGWRYGQSLPIDDPLYMQATTACLSAIIVMQIVNVFLCRSADRPVSATGLRGNRLIVYGVVVEIALVLLIDYTAPGNAIFGTAPIGAGVWLFVVPFAAGMIALEELRKWLARRWLRQRS